MTIIYWALIAISVYTNGDNTIVHRSQDAETIKKFQNYEECKKHEYKSNEEYNKSAKFSIPGKKFQYRCIAVKIDS